MSFASSGSRNGAVHALAVSLSIVAAAAAGPARAVTFAEQGDAGHTPSQAQTTVTAGPPGAVLTAITGTILSAADADVFLITIADPLAFSASTFNSGTGEFLDTQLFLFSATGAPIYMNDDDAGGLTVRSTLPAGSSLRPTTPGSYLLGISLAGADPVNAVNQVLFEPLGSFVETTDVRGPNAGLQPPFLSGFSFEAFAGSGAYQIQLTGATVAIPEPSTWLLLAVGTAGLPWLARRRRGQRAAPAAV